MSIALVTGSPDFIPRAFSKILSFDNMGKTYDWKTLEIEAGNLLKKNKWIDLPLLIENLKIDVDTASMLIQRLREKGIISPKDDS